MSVAPAPADPEETLRTIREAVDAGRDLAGIERHIERLALDPDHRAALALYAWAYHARGGASGHSGPRPGLVHGRPPAAPLLHSAARA